MLSGPSILRQFGGIWRFRKVDDQATEVQFIYNFKVKPRLLSWLLEPLVAAVYRRSMGRRLQAFKTWAENVAVEP